MKKWSLFLLVPLLLGIAATAMAGTTMEDAQKYQADLDEGIRLLKTGSVDDIHRSIAKFKAALKLRSESAEAYYWIGLAYSDLNQYLRAANNARDATNYDDRMAEAWLLWGQVLLYQEEWSEALAKLETASRLAPDDPIVAFNLGRVYYHGYKNLETAYSKFDAAWKLGQALRRERPELATLVNKARLYMGYCELDRGRNLDNAIACFREVLQAEPANYDAALRLALAYRRSYRAGESEVYLRNLIKVLEQADGPAERQILAEANLQLADMYLKDPVMKNRMFAIIHLKEFVRNLGNNSHPALDAAREFLAANELPEHR